MSTRNSRRERDADRVRRVSILWTSAIATADVEQLGRLMTDDIVVVHGSGRTVSGRDAVMAEFAGAFKNFRLQQTIRSEETIVAGDWAFERAQVHTVIIPHAGAETREVDSQTLTILRKGKSNDWRVGRSIGVICCQQGR